MTETPDQELPVLSTLDELAELVRARPGLYVRYSRGPAEDRHEKSTDYESGAELPGLAVNPLDPESWWRRDLRLWLARKLRNYAHLAEQSGDGRRAWLLAGEVVARGPDNEPLVAGCEAVALLSEGLVDEARVAYETNFEVGRDSRD